MHFERGAFFVVRKMLDILLATRNYFQKSALPSESVFLLALMQASFQ
jgi:hypothetical protein